MTTATQVGTADKILLTIGEVIEHSLTVAAAETERYQRESEAEAKQAAAQELAFFKSMLAEKLDIDGSDLERPVLEFEHGGLPFRIFWSSRDHRLIIVQLCSTCRESWAGPYLDQAIRNHSELGHYLSSSRAAGVCQECRAANEPAAPSAAQRRPTIEERLYAIVREIALDAAVEVCES